MKKRFREALALRCKDMGLTSKAIDKLAELGSKGLTDETTDEEIESAVDEIVPYAREMQAEITRKYSRRQPSREQSNEEGENEGENTQDRPQGGAGEGALAEILKRISKLEDENKTLRNERSKAEKRAALKAELKEQGINDFFGDFISVPEGEDVKEFITKFKQGYISANLPSKDDSQEQGGSSLEQRKQAAREWAKSQMKSE